MTTIPMLSVPAAECGRICATATRAQRQLASRAAEYAELFPRQPFDGTFYATLAFGNAFAGPWLTADELWAVNTIAAWFFAMDLAVDTHARSLAEVRDIAHRCIAVAEGASPAPGDSLAALLADVRDRLAAGRAFAGLGALWPAELRRVFAAMTREWTWKRLRAGNGRLPTLDEYLDNASNIGYVFSFLTHWIATSLGEPRRIPEVRAAVHQVQRVIRLANDLGTYRRDISWGERDLNALMLEVAADQVVRRRQIEVDRARELLHPLGALPERVWLERQMDYLIAYYPHVDFWGDLPET